jgi:hypothetical protein
MLHREPHFTYLCSTDNNTYVQQYTQMQLNVIETYETHLTFKHFQRQACLLWDIVSERVDKRYTHSRPATRMRNPVGGACGTSEKENLETSCICE